MMECSEATEEQWHESRRPRRAHSNQAEPHLPGPLFICKLFITVVFKIEGKYTIKSLRAKGSPNFILQLDTNLKDQV